MASASLDKFLTADPEPLCSEIKLELGERFSQASPAGLSWCTTTRQQTCPFLSMQDHSPMWVSYFPLVAGSFCFYPKLEVGNL